MTRLPDPLSVCFGIKNGVLLHHRVALGSQQLTLTLEWIVCDFEYILSDLALSLSIFYLTIQFLKIRKSSTCFFHPGSLSWMFLFQRIFNKHQVYEARQLSQPDKFTYTRHKSGTCQLQSEESHIMIVTEKEQMYTLKVESQPSMVFFPFYQKTYCFNLNVLTFKGISPHSLTRLLDM